MADLITEQLRYIDPDGYDEWMKVGAALKHEGYPCSVWDDWSRGSAKYRPGECERKWESFRENNAGEIVTGGTIWHMAAENGWEPPRYEGELTEGMLIRSTDERIIDPTFAREGIPEVEDDYNPLADSIRYIEELFRPDEFIGFCVESQRSEKGKLVPSASGQMYGFNPARLINLISDNFVREREGGAWIRFNPLDGRGCGNSNVTRFDYALVESDDDDIEKQYAIYQQLNLPIKVLVHSGNKSLHAIVKVQARDADEYRDRVRRLYKVCSENGLHVDEQDKNASRYSRFPGFKRGGTWQRSIAWDIGAASWAEWVDWLEGEQDVLPKEIDLRDAMIDLPPLKDELICGLLRHGHKMLVSAPSKAGKSFLMMELAVCIAEGMAWIGFPVRQGKVLYVNLELDSASCMHRFSDIYERFSLSERHYGNITVLNLRGYAVGLAELARTIIRRFKNAGYSAIIFDPLYKLNEGDENNAGDMTRLCNQFDLIARECGCSVIYSHHFSKGASAKYSSAMDRSSGSGVLARDPDCIITMSELQVSEMHAGMYREAYGLPKDKKLSGWELAFTVREFPTPDTARVWFDWPIHVTDDAGWLNDATYDNTNGAGVGKGQTRKANRQSAIAAAYAAILKDGDNAVKREQLLEQIEKDGGVKWEDKTLDNALQSSPYMSRKLAGGIRAIAQRGCEQIVFSGTRYLKPEKNPEQSIWPAAE